MVKHLPAMQETRFNPWVGKIPWRREWQPTPVGEFHGQRSLAGYSPWGHKNWTHHHGVSHAPSALLPAPTCVHRSALRVHLHLCSCWSSPLLITDTVCRAAPCPHSRVGRNQFLPSSVGTGVGTPRCGETALGACWLLPPLPSQARVLLLRKPQIAQPSPGDRMMEPAGACSWAKSTKVIMSTKRNLKDGCKNCCS